MRAASIVAFVASVPVAFCFAPVPTNSGRHDTTNLFLQKQPSDFFADLRTAGVLAALTFGILTNPLPSFADGSTKEFKLPPIDFTDKDRCRLTSSSMGQANAARDKLYDLRQCKLSGAKANGYDLSGVILTDTDLSQASFKESYFSKGYMRDSIMDGADFSYAIVDRASFKGSSLKGTIFFNTVLTGTSFEDANVENADFTEAYLGDFDIRSLCKNPTLKGENPVTGADTKMSVGCK